MTLQEACSRNRRANLKVKDLSQSEIQEKGNKYLDDNFPDLTSIVSVSLDAPGATPLNPTFKGGEQLPPPKGGKSERTNFILLQTTSLAVRFFRILALYSTSSIF